MGGQGPRVKYFLQTGRSQPSFSVAVADTPTVVANSLPVRVVRQLSPQVIDWMSATGMRCSISGTTATPGLSPR